MFEMIALVLGCVKCFVFYLPTCSSGSHHVPNALFVQESINDPTKSLDTMALRAPILQHIDQHIRMRLVDHDITKPTKIMLSVVLLGNSQLVDRAIFASVLDLVKEVFVVRRFGHQDEMALGLLQCLDGRSFGTEIIGCDRHFQLAVVLAKLLQPTLHGILFAVVFGLSIFLTDRFGHQRDNFFFVWMNQRSTQGLVIISDLCIRAFALTTIGTMDAAGGKILSSVQRDQVGVFDALVLGQDFGSFVRARKYR